MKKSAQCSICTSNPFKYTCPTCSIQYCSVGCYKKHKESCATARPSIQSQPTTLEDFSPPKETKAEEEVLEDQPVLKSLSSVKWPYVPEESAFPDPLKRDDPKTLQLRHYEAIATSKAIRTTLLSNPALKPLLTSLDTLRGVERERAIQRALGVTPPDIRASSSSSHPATSPSAAHVAISNDLPGVYASEEQTRALRELAEAVEACVRDPEKGGKGAVELGLDWERFEEEGHATAS